MLSALGEQNRVDFEAIGALGLQPAADVKRQVAAGRVQAVAPALRALPQRRQRHERLSHPQPGGAERVRDRRARPDDQESQEFRQRWRQRVDAQLSGP